MATSSKIVIRIPAVNVVNTPIFRRWQGNVAVHEPVVYRDRTYVLGDNVKYIEYDKHPDRNSILIHYVNNTCDELSHSNGEETLKLYERIIDALKDSGTFIDPNEA